LIEVGAKKAATEPRVPNDHFESFAVATMTWLTATQYLTNDH